MNRPSEKCEHEAKMLLLSTSAYADATKLWNCLNASFVDVQNGNWDKFEKLS